MLYKGQIVISIQESLLTHFRLVREVRIDFPLYRKLYGHFIRHNFLVTLGNISTYRAKVLYCCSARVTVGLTLNPSYQA